MSIRTRALGVLTALAMAVALLGAPAPANAHSATGNWSGFHTLCRHSGSCVTEGHLVRMWQTILYSTQNWSNEIHGCSYFVDGEFGPHTAEMTMGLQHSWVLEDDGWVGSNTWSRAWGQVRFTSATSTAIYYTFKGAISSFSVRKLSSSGVWQFKDICGSGIYITLTHN